MLSRRSAQRLHGNDDWPSGLCHVSRQTAMRISPQTRCETQFSLSAPLSAGVQATMDFDGRPRTNAHHRRELENAHKSLRTNWYGLPWTSVDYSGRRGSNSQHSAWKADALPIELHPHAVNSSRKQFISLSEVRRKALFTRFSATSRAESSIPRLIGHGKQTPRR